MSNSKGDSRSKKQTVECEEDITKRMSVIRLQNLCFNSVLQQLIHIMIHTEYKLVLKKHSDLKTLTFTHPDKKTEPGKLTKELFKLIHETTYQKFLRTVTRESMRNEIAGKFGKFSDTFDGEMIRIVKCEDCGNLLNIHKEFLDTFLHLQTDSKKDSQICNSSYNQLQGEIKSKSEEAKGSKNNNGYLGDYLMRSLPLLFIEDNYVCNNCKSSEDKGKEGDTYNLKLLMNTTVVKKISAFFNYFNPVKKFGEKRKHNSESITHETKDAAAESQKRQKHSDDCKNNRTKSMRVIGLSNLGNTCYFNSVLQNLLYLRPFRELLSYTMTRTKYKLVPKKHPELETIEFVSDKKAEPGQLTQELFNLKQETVYQSEATEGTSGKKARKKIAQKIVKPRAVQIEIEKKHEKFSDGSQQDSHELFRSMIDMVKDEEIKRLKEAFEKHFNNKDNETQSKNCSVDKNKYASEFENIFVFTGTFIDDTFGGEMISTVKCEGCKSILEVNEDFLDISLPLPEYSQKYNILSSNQPQSGIESNSEEEVKVKSKEVKRLNRMANDYPKDSLEYYLMRFFLPIFLEDDYVCNNCNPQLTSNQDETSDTNSSSDRDKNRSEDDTDSIDYDSLKFTSAVKQFHIKSVGPVLTIHLKRFSQTGYGLQKLNKRVDFPLVLDMSPFCVSDTSVPKDRDNQILYGLRGIVEHSGGIRFGHYVAYVNIADWNVPSKISDDDSAKSRRAGKSIENRNSTHQAMDTDPAQGNRMTLTSENSTCEPPFHPTSPLTSSSYLEHVMPAEDWYHISDSYISKTNHDYVFSSQAYILFYERLPLIT